MTKRRGRKISRKRRKTKRGLRRTVKETKEEKKRPMNILALCTVSGQFNLGHGDDRIGRFCTRWLGT
jgi:hypothetical protein